MSFVATLRVDDPPLVDRDGDTFTVAADIGYDDERDVVYTFIVSLAPRMGCEDGVVDLMFYVVASGDGDDERKYWSGLDTQEFLQGDIRQQLLTFLVDAVVYLVTEATPSQVHICTIDTHLPEKALIKYELILDVFRHRGYTVVTDEPYHGCHLWRAERPGPFE